MTLRVIVRDPVGRIVGVGELTDEYMAQIGDTTVFVRCDYPEGPPLFRRPMEFVQVELEPIFGFTVIGCHGRHG